mgnify:CR=1 FL=1
MVILLPRQVIVSTIALVGLAGLLAIYLGQAIAKSMAVFTRSPEGTSASFLPGLCAPAVAQASTNLRPALFIGCGSVE